MKVLITGSSGFIGKYLVDECLKKGYEINTLTRNSKLKIPKTNTFYGDITDYKSIQPAFKNVDFVIHNAAYAKDWGRKELFYKYNVEGTKNIAEACIKNKVKHLIYTSSAGVYGFPNNTNPISENQVTEKPLNAYGWSKIESENILKKYKDLKITIFRPPMVFGAGGYTTKILLDSIKNEKATLIKNGQSRISIVHPVDIARCYILALEQEKLGAFNVVSFNTSIKDIYDGVAKQLKVPIPNKSVPFFLAYIIGFFSEIFTKKEPTITRFRVIKVGTSRKISCEKAKKELGYKPTFTLSKTITDMVTWYNQNYS